MKKTITRLAPAKRTVRKRKPKPADPQRALIFGRAGAADLPSTSRPTFCQIRKPFRCLQLGSLSRTFDFNSAVFGGTDPKWAVHDALRSLKR